MTKIIRAGTDLHFTRSSDSRVLHAIVTGVTDQSTLTVRVGRTPYDAVRAGDGVGWVEGSGVDPGLAVLQEAALFLDWSSHDGSQQIANSGTLALAGQLGSTSGADSNDPATLAYGGKTYLHCPGSANNYIRYDAGLAGTVTRVKIAARIRRVTNDGYRGVFGPQGGWLYWHPDNQNYGVYLQGGTYDMGAAAGTFPIATGIDYWLMADFNTATGTGTMSYSLDDTNDAEAVSWTQFHSATIATGTISTGEFATMRFGSGYNDGDLGLAGRLYAGALWANGTLVSKFSMDGVAGNAASVTPEVGPTMPILRSTTGRKATVVNATTGLFGTDDNIEVVSLGDNASLPFVSSGDFTVLWSGRVWSGNGNYRKFWSRGESSGCYIDTGAAGNVPRIVMQGGVTAVGDFAGSFAYGERTVLGMVVDRSADTAQGFLAGEMDANILDITGVTGGSTQPFRVNCTGDGAGYFLDSEGDAVAVWDRILTPTEIAAATDYLTGR